MAWLQSLDAALFRFINQSLSHPAFDAIAPFFSWNPVFVPALALVALGLLWKGGARGRICLVMLALAVVVGDGVICNSLKHAIARPRPFNEIPEAHVLVGRGGSGSLPSSHAANWFAATLVCFVYYRRSLRFMLPLACLVAFSRIYNGVHYPSDVLAGAALGAGSAAWVVWSAHALWQRLGKKWFPLWWSRVPSWLDPDAAFKIYPPASAAPPPDPQPSTSDQHWLRLGCLLIGALLLARLGYLASGKIELSEDEAYQWLWSKHLALSYFSKPPLIAWTQFLGTALWGDTAFGVRFFSPVMAAVLSLAMLRFVAREAGARAAFWLLLVVTATPLLAVGTILMTIDPLSVLFWTAAMISGWRAVQRDSTRHWLWTGLWMGLGFLSKYTALFQLLCWAVFFALWKPARTQLRRPGPYLALLLTGLCALPVWIWNQQHGWITVTHLASRGGLDQAWKPKVNFFQDFLLAEFFLLNPVFFVAMVWAAIVFWKKSPRNPLLVYLFSMGAPLFLFYLLYTLRARVQPNWIAPAALPLLTLMVLYVEARWPEMRRRLKPWLAVGLFIGLSAVVLLHDTNLAAKIIGRPMPAAMDPARRVRVGQEMARVVGVAREKLAAEGKPVFIIGGHYGVTSLLSFYLAEARAAVSRRPLVYYQSADSPQNQFYFWPGYQDRKGENALFVLPADSPQMAPERLLREFESVTDLGMREIKYRDRVFRRVQLFECRNLR